MVIYMNNSFITAGNLFNKTCLHPKGQEQVLSQDTFINHDSHLKKHFYVELITIQEVLKTLKSLDT